MLCNFGRGVHFFDGNQCITPYTISKSETYAHPSTTFNKYTGFWLQISQAKPGSAISFCRCPTADGKRGDAEFKQLLRAGIFPGSIKEPKTGYTLGLLDYYRQQRSQGKGSAYNFVHVLRCMADPIFAGSVPDIYANFLAITRFYEYLRIIIQTGHAHEVDVPLPGEADGPYPNQPKGFLGAICAACPERGVNMPSLSSAGVTFAMMLMNTIHLISTNKTLDGNYKQNLFFKRDDGSDTALTDGKMHFPLQAEYEDIVKTHVVAKEDTEVPCKAHIGSIRHQGLAKYGNVAVTGVVACACDHSVAGSFVDMLKGEAFALGTYAQREDLRHTNSPPHGPESTTPTVFSYDSYCSFVVEGQIPADHINGHGVDCQAIWQAVYFACHAHFHGETAEVLCAFLNPLGSSTQQMTAAVHHNIINFVIDARNRLKIVRQAELLAAERRDALQLFELHMAVLEDLSRQHATEVAAWSRLSRVTTKSASGKISSVYQHETTKGMRENTTRERVPAEDIGGTVDSRRNWDPASADTWDSITKLRDGLNADLKKFRDRQREVYPRLTLSVLDVDEPELTAIQLLSYHMKHGQRSVDADGEDAELREVEIKLRCSQADNGIIAVRGACLALSAVKKVWELDYRGQNGVTHSQRNREKAELMKTYEITMYNNARTVLVHLGHMEKDTVEPYRPLSIRDTRRKETHLHRAKGDSRLFDGTAWYLQSGVMISSAAVGSRLAPGKRDEGNEDDDDDNDRLMAGTQTLKRAGFTNSQRTPKRLKDIAPDDVNVEASSSSEAEESNAEMSPTKAGKQKAEKERKSKKKPDGWIWLESMTQGQKLSKGKLAEYKKESDRVQWHRAEAEMYRWLEQYERKHVEGFRVIERFRRDSVVWAGLADCEEARNGINGATTFARMQVAMYSRLEHNAKVIFKSAALGVHHDWVSATSFDELVTKIDGWRDVVFKWMDEMGLQGFLDYTRGLKTSGLKCQGTNAQPANAIEVVDSLLSDSSNKCIR
ncbi:hypothetical protein B0H10DRAFT_1968575 [Mycena sp. CBHHK59/15]|nr:hypothetical protein B0H10DRAFT_1968575 [Mycena sp. CBHHK59/15]